MPRPKPKPKTQAQAATRRRWPLALALAAAAFSLYARSAGFGYVNFDDVPYIVENLHVRGGLTWAGLWWALTTIDYFYWQPLTWLSHMLDVSLFGLAPGGHHLHNALLHAVNSGLAFYVLSELTGSRGRAAAVAALFALHPLRAESVAWLAERKDLLAGLVWLLACLAYLHYTRAPSRRRYLLLLACFVAGLAAKPVLVTLPFALLLLDFWPLHRPLPWTRLALEKLPLVVLAAAASWMTTVGQRRYGAMNYFDWLPLDTRLANAVLSYCRYLGKTFWPEPLAILYPYRTEIGAGEVVAALLLLAAITGLVVWQRTRRPYLFTGWFWFAGVLVPTIGLVQVGPQPYADRFTYIPSIGLNIALVWLAAEWLPRRWQTPALAVALGACVLVTVNYLPSWRDCLSAFEHAVAVAPGSSVAENNLGFCLVEAGRGGEAIEHLRRATAREPRVFTAQYLLGKALYEKGAVAEALAPFRAAIEHSPRYAEAHYGLGAALLRLNDQAGAERHLREALKLQLAPAVAARAWNDLGVIEAQRGRLDEARAAFRAAVRLDPTLRAAQDNLKAAGEAAGGPARPAR
jgi:tetratricopeptide (TPR) repeat protein